MVCQTPALYSKTRAITGAALGMAKQLANQNAQMLGSFSNAIPSLGPITDTIKRVVDTGKEAAESRGKLYNDLVLPEKFDPLPYDPTLPLAHVDSPMGYLRESIKQGIRVGLEAKSRHDRRLKKFFTPGNDAPVQPSMMPDTQSGPQYNQNQIIQMMQQMLPVQQQPMQQQFTPEMLQHMQIANVATNDTAPATTYATAATDDTDAISNAAGAANATTSPNATTDPNSTAACSPNIHIGHNHLSSPR